MSMYSCEICKKEFKTTQHLNQHKNRKKTCVNNTNNSLNSTDNLGLGGINIKTNLTVVDVVNFIKTYKNIVEFVEDSKKISEYKNIILELKKQNLQLKQQLSAIEKVIQPKNVTVKKHSLSDLEISPLTDDNEYDNKDNNVDEDNTDEETYNYDNITIKLK